MSTDGEYGTDFEASCAEAMEEIVRAGSPCTILIGNIRWPADWGGLERDRSWEIGGKKILLDAKVVIAGRVTPDVHVGNLVTVIRKGHPDARFRVADLQEDFAALTLQLTQETR